MRQYTVRTCSAVCLRCKQPFSYERTTGMKRRHCSAACREAYKLARRPVKQGPRRKPPLRHAAGKYITAAGYVKLLHRNHPLASKEGHVFEHRAVVYAKHDGRCPDCFWCGAKLDWEEAVVDHLNEVKSDNRPDNLLIACNPCNRARGALLPFIARMRGEAVRTFIDAAMAYRDALCKKCHDGEKARQEAASGLR